MAVTDKKAHRAIEKARTVLIVSQPFFGCLALHLDIQERADPKWWAPVTSHPTMAVDGFCMYYHPEFVNSLSDQELVGVVAHEVFHCVYKHMTRRNHRDRTIWNWAGDYVINDDLLSAGFTLPKKRLHDPKYKGMSTEEVYDRLNQETLKIKIRVKGKDGGGGGGDDPDKGECGAVLDAGGPGETAKKQLAERDWEANVRTAINAAVRQAGTVPAYLERLVSMLKKPKVSWRDQTRQFIDGTMSKDFSWARPNRRFAGSGLILPGYVPDSLHHLVMVIDVSGSITEALMTACVSEVAGALDDGVADQLTLLYVDAALQKVESFTQGDVVKAKSCGGGGTDFRPAFDWIMNNAPDASCMVYLTDMMPCSWDLPEPQCPVLWAAWCPESYLAQVKVPFGSVVHVDSADG